MGGPSMIVNLTLQKLSHLDLQAEIYIELRFWLCMNKFIDSYCILYKSKTQFHLGDLWYTKGKILTLLFHQSNYWKWEIISCNCIIRCITFLSFSWCLCCNSSDVKVQLQCFLPSPCTWISLVIHHVCRVCIKVGIATQTCWSTALCSGPRNFHRRYNP